MGTTIGTTQTLPQLPLGGPTQSTLTFQTVGNDFHNMTTWDSKDNAIIFSTSWENRFFFKLHSGCSHSKEKVGRRTSKEGREGPWHRRRCSRWGPSLRMPCTLLPLLSRSPQQKSPQSQSDFTAQEKEVSPCKRQEKGRPLFSELNKKAGYGSTLLGFPGKSCSLLQKPPKTTKGRVLVPMSPGTSHLLLHCCGTVGRLKTTQRGPVLWLSRQL